MQTPLADFAQWCTARFQSEEARDQFLGVVAIQHSSDVEVVPMPEQSRAALVRWRPGQFLGLNDVAYANGGRIILGANRRRRG